MTSSANRLSALRSHSRRIEAALVAHVTEVDQRRLYASLPEAAVTEKLERLEAKRYAQTKRPRKSLAETDVSGKSRYVPAP